MARVANYVPVNDSTPKSWYNWNGTTTIVERESFNVSSLTDLGVGNYTVNINNNMANGNYGIGIAVEITLGTATRYGGIDFGTTPAVGAYEIATTDQVPAASDSQLLSGHTLGDLA